ncbi:MAG TPA: TIGR01777 family protein [Desulfobulbaceae bacterium]|nr:TIGR01777 family protein [Desulfobulbaceae bacterium]
MNILLSGTQERLGVTLLHHLFACGHTLTCLQTRQDESGDTVWDIERLWQGRAERPYDAIIHLGGDNLLDHRWNQGKKQRIQDSRIEGTRQLVDFLWSQPGHLRPETLISTSSIGYYGDTGERLLGEGNLAGIGFFAGVCKQWERQALRAAEIGIRVLCLRLGMILSPEDGLVPKLLPLFRAGLGGVFGNGGQYQSWVSIRDVCRAVTFLLEKPSIRGPVNLVTPKPATNREFADALATALGKSARAPVPASLLRLFFGEMADALLLASRRVSPDCLRQAGFIFQDYDLAAAVAWCAGVAEPPAEPPA